MLLVRLTGFVCLGNFQVWFPFVFHFNRSKSSLIFSGSQEGPGYAVVLSILLNLCWPKTTEVFLVYATSLSLAGRRLCASWLLRTLGLWRRHHIEHCRSLHQRVKTFMESHLDKQVPHLINDINHFFPRLIQTQNLARQRHIEWRVPCWKSHEATPSSDAMW